MLCGFHPLSSGIEGPKPTIQWFHHHTDTEVKALNIGEFLSSTSSVLFPDTSSIDKLSIIHDFGMCPLTKCGGGLDIFVLDLDLANVEVARGKAADYFKSLSAE